MKNKQTFHEFCSQYRGYDFFTKTGQQVYKYQIYCGMINIEELTKKVKGK